MKTTHVTVPSYLLVPGGLMHGCFHSHLNGPYYHNPVVSSNNGIIWAHWKGWYYSFKFTEMKTRRNN